MERVVKIVRQFKIMGQDLDTNCLVSFNEKYPNVILFQSFNAKNRTSLSTPIIFIPDKDNKWIPRDGFRSPCELMIEVERVNTLFIN